MEALRTYIKKEKISQNELARRLGKNKFDVSRWVNGKTYPSVDTLKVMHQKLGIPLAKLMQ